MKPQRVSSAALQANVRQIKVVSAHFLAQLNKHSGISQTVFYTPPSFWRKHAAAQILEIKFSIRKDSETVWS